ncbi:MAG: hypothetical protein Ta2B_21220 [Termitinemataceae bacterium]|nr:MAG: hypothetical protein Ta2B_21220 [Termitinemataceae bacterium]
MNAYFIASAALILSVGSAIYLFFFIKKRTSESFISQKNRAEVAALINDIDRVTDRDLELIEDRANKLRSLLAEIDKHILVYDNAAKRITMHANTVRTSIEESEIAIKKSKEEQQKVTETSYRKLGKLSNYRGNVVEKAVDEVPLFTAENIAQQETLTEKEQPLSEVAEKMDATGIPKHEIAKRLGVTVAEVDLALFVSKQK